MQSAPLPSADALRLYQLICDWSARGEDVSFARCRLHAAADAWHDLITCGWLQHTYRPCVQVAVMPEAVGRCGNETRLKR